jgi:hypothetical protein
MRVYYCTACGKRVELEEIEDNSAVEVDGLMYCAKCAEAAIPVASVAEVEVIPEGPVHCDRCNAVVDPADLQSGKAVGTGGHFYCANCTAMYLPLLEALKAKQGEGEPARPHRRRTPAYGMRSMTSERPAEPRVLAFEKKTNVLPIIGIAAGVVILIVILAVAMSGSPTTTPKKERPVNRTPVTPVPDPPPVKPIGTPRFTEDPRAKKAIEAADAYARANHDNYDSIISQYEHIEKSYRLSSSQAAHVQRAIGETRLRREHEAQKMLDKLLAQAEELVKKGDYSGAIAALRKYPSSLKSVGDCWSRVQARIDKLEKDEKAEGPFKLLKVQAEVFRKQKKEQEAIEEFKKFMEEHAGSSFAAEAKELVAQLETAIEKREAGEQRAKDEAEEKREAEIDKMRVSDPLYYADFTGKELKSNIKVRYKDCDYPFESGQGSYALAVRKANASMNFEFSLLDKPKHALLYIAHLISTHKEGAGHLTVTIELNGKAIEKDKRYVSGEAPLALEFDVADKLAKGKNKLTVMQTAGNVGWVLEKFEFRAFYDGDGWAKEKKEADAKVKTAVADYKKWLSDREKEKEKEIRKLARKFERGALPALKPGKTYNLLKSKSLKGWKLWGEGGEWKFENGELVGRNNNLKWGSLLATSYKRQNDWKDYTLTLKFVFKGSCEHRVYLRTSYPKEEDKLPAGLRLLVAPKDQELNVEREVKLVIEGGKASAFVDGAQTLKDHAFNPELKKGFIGIQLGPNATVHIKKMTLELKR